MPGFAESVTVTTLDRVPTALGVNGTVKVHLAWAARVPAQGVTVPGAMAKSPLPVMVGVSAVARLLVIVTVWAALAVATVWAANVSVPGLKESGCTAGPFKSKTCWLT